MDHRIEVAHRGAPLRCVVCHGDLDAAAGSCDGCGVAFHADCRPATGCVTPGCAGRAAQPSSAPSTAPSAARTAHEHVDLGAWLQNSVLAVAAVALLVWGVAWVFQSPAPTPGGEREAEPARQATKEEQERLRHERRADELRDHLAALRAALTEADARKEPFRRMALEQVRWRACEVAIGLRAWGEPGMRQLLDELGAASRREGERATVEELEEGYERFLQEVRER